jgi:aminodeoxyfutalosine deaminase
MALEVCLTSNLKLGVFGMTQLKDHPLPRLLEKGLCLTINSDDPPMFNTTLTNEFQLLRTVFEMDVKSIQTFVFNAVRVSLLPEVEKEKLRTEIEEQLGRLEEQRSQRLFHINNKHLNSKT